MRQHHAEIPTTLTATYEHRRMLRADMIEMRGEELGATEDVDVVIDPRGGMTIARLRWPNGKVAAVGVALCRFDENYSKKVGRPIALGRALCAYYGEPPRIGPRIISALEFVDERDAS
jgi:hypothetical protein